MSKFDNIDSWLYGVSQLNTYKNQIDSLPDDYKIDLSDFEKTLDKIYQNQLNHNQIEDFKKFYDEEIFPKEKSTKPILKNINKSTKITKTINKPLIINFVGEPGAGKSWAAWYLSAKLKQNGFKVEYLPEFAKSKLYEHSEKVFTCEPYIFGKQLYKMHSMSDEVDIIVTDSPIILPHFYEKDEQSKELLKQLELYHFNQFNNLNICLMRDHDYKQEGRFQTENQAEELHNEIMNFLMENHIDYYSFFTSHIESEHFWEWLVEYMEGCDLYE